jgi:sugar phosphate isomerase/epimerase
MTKTADNRRSFLKKTTGLIAGLGLGTNAFATSEKQGNQPLTIGEKPAKLPNNPLVLFDNFHSGNRRSYSLKARMAAAQAAGFDGFELVSLDPGTDAWKEAMDLIPTTSFKVWGLHRTTSAVVDDNVDRINEDIEKIEAAVEAGAKSPAEYMSLSLSGGGELRGATIHESGSAKAEDRHWERAYKIISAFDKACKKHGLRGALYPHTHWLCDTPQSQAKILEGAGATTIGPAFCSHHWYANKNSLELDETFKLPMMKKLNYVVLTNGRFEGNGFPAVRFDTGEIDMAWMLAKIYEFGYEGPISSQGWAIGGDPFVSARVFVDTIRSLRKRFDTQPELWPLR